MFCSYNRKTKVKLTISFFLSMVIVTNPASMPVCSAASYPEPANTDAKFPESDRKEPSTSKVNDPPKSPDHKGRGPESETQKRVKATIAELPLSFEINRGQADAPAKFLSRGNGYNLYLTDSESILVLGKAAADEAKNRPHIKRAHRRTTPSAVIKMKLAGSNKHPRITGLEELTGKSNYFIGNDPRKWHINVSHYAKVKYEEVYPGIDVVYHGDQGELEYDFVVSSGADPSSIKMQYEGTRSLRLNNKGDLMIGVAGGEICLHTPIVYQEMDGQKIQISVRYVLKRKTEVTFQIGTFDHSKALIIDPQISYSSYLGGGDEEYAEGIQLDGSGNIYVGGTTRSTDFPVANPYQSTHGADFWDAYVTKLDPTGSTLIYSTYLGGNGEEDAHGLAVDNNGSASITGMTESDNFPTVNAFQSSHGGGSRDGFVTKLNAAGSALLYSTYLGGSGEDTPSAIAVDSAGCAYVTGETSSANFPTVNAFQPTIGGSDAFISKLSALGSTLLYSSFLGGSGIDIGNDVTVDSSGSAYIVGITTSTNFPTINPRQSTFAGVRDTFVTKINPTGTALLYSTYHGGPEDDFGSGIAVDASGNAYVTGEAGTGFPLVAAFQSTYGGGVVDAFVSKFDPSGSSLLYSTYLGGGAADTPHAIALDATNNVYVTGETTSTNFPRMLAVQNFNAGGTDAFVTKLDASGSTLIFSTYLGGSGGDYPKDIALNADGDVYLTGQTTSTNFPTVNPFQSSKGGFSDSFVVKITGLNSYLIQGHITDALDAGLSSVTVALSGSASTSVQTDAAGYYMFVAGAGGNYTVTPTKAPYTFVPASRTFNNLSAAQTADFTVATHGISGSVTNAGAPVEGVTLVLSGTQSTTTQTDANGTYNFPAVAKGGNYTLTPSKADPILTYSFVPSSQTINGLNANQTINFSSSNSIVSALNSTGDAYVQDGTGASSNFGLATTLKVETDSKTNNSKNFDVYLKFDVSGVAGNIGSVKLRILASSSTAAGASTGVYSVSTTSWIESGPGGITWNNKPARSATALAGSTATINSTTPASYDLDITNYVRDQKNAGRDVISLALHNPSSSTVFVTLNSREAATNKPQLIVTTSPSLNTAPSVALTNPLPGVPFTSPANVTVSANATDSDGTISKVEFYAGTTLIGTVTTAPYQITWGPVSAGDYSLTAVATDNSSLTTVSPPVAITVGLPNIAPSVTLDSPLGGTTFPAGSNIPLVATALDLDGTISNVEFFAGASLVATATVPSSGAVYSVTWTNVNSGAYALTAKATDNVNGTTTSSVVNINVVSQTGLSSIADAYVRDGASASTNFGTTNELQTQVSAVGSNRETYLKFDITAISGIVNAKLRLYGRLSDTSAMNVSAAVYPVLTSAPDWTESGNGSITWNNKPATGAALTSVTVTDNNARWYEWNIADYVKAEKDAGRNIIKLAIKNTTSSTPYATFNSREADNNRPQMILWTTQARNALLVANSTTLGVGDNAVKTRLQNLGYTVTVKGSGNNNAIQTSDANGKTVVLISSSVTSANVLAKFRHVPIPMIIWKSDLFDDQGMTGSILNADFGTATGQTQLAIVNSTHPLAAGLTASPTVSASSSFTWGNPNTNAARIATLVGDATKFVIFGYDNMATMVGPNLDAPARRVGFFLTDLTSNGLTPEGNSLFDAAVKWATEVVTTPVISSLTPSNGLAGTQVSINGANFGTQQGTSTVTFNGASATVSSWNHRSVIVAVPVFATTGPVVITVNGVVSNGVIFSVSATDSDGDGLPDTWELQYFGNLSQSANGDPDGDGLTNLQEFQQGRNPTKSALADDGDFVNLKLYTPLSSPLP
ncbi:MAG TPA: SBBP repeat-containing protein [Pyrinomonadaceae bacterium]|nr:SBBP repeat-containing protein [Pyrinomonadaceae bacterium]